MTTLAEFTPATRVVPVKGRDGITVRGLNLSDFTLLLAAYKDTAQTAADEFFSLAAEEQDYATLALTLLQAYPVMCGQIIACGCGDSGLLENAMALPFPLQIELLTAICELTFEEVGGPKGCAATVARVAKMAGVKTLPASLAKLAAWANRNS